MQQRKWVSVLAAGAMLSTMLAGCMEKHGELGNRNIRGNSVKYDMNGNRILNTRFANDQMNEMNRADGHRLNSNNLVGLHKNYRMETSQSMSDRISQLDGVGDAHVMLTDDNAYVALSLKKAGHGTNALSYYSPTTISRTQQAHMRPYSMKSSNSHAFTSKSKGTRASSIATPNMRLKRSVSGAGIIRAKSLNENSLHAKSLPAKAINGKSLHAKSMHGKSMNAGKTRLADGRSSSSFHNVSNGMRNMSLSQSTNHLLSRNMNNMTAHRSNGMMYLSRDTSRGLTNTSRDLSFNGTNMYSNTTGTSNAGRDLYRGMSNAGTDIARGTANAGSNLLRGTANVGSDILRGTANIGSDILHGTANVGSDILRGTGNVGSDLARGTGNVGTDVARGTANVGSDILRGTANVGTNVARGTANVGSDILRGTANVGTDVARGTANVGTDVLRGTGNAGTDLARGTANVGHDIARGVRNLSEDTADLLTGRAGVTHNAGRGAYGTFDTGTTGMYGSGTTGMYGSGMTNLSRSTTNLSRSTTDLSRGIMPYAVNPSTANSDVPTALKAEIDRLIKQMSPQIKNVYISADPEFMDRMASYTADVKKGNTIQPYIAEFNAMVDRIFPVRARS
ncbi:hypothetical protein GXP70_22855 [Paenibacillus lycopersici]|uniref:YhcN/YlaJ family sporulation lipoprotein n=1 Tax=Paenibacillus lycopersici TaxID=2704462 RepID=A0A6C0FZH4_9BACL|nr:YhcN/YlaJ family sporulation lipoprotein [Paenibacillus lycopersici]QHT62538.1 hypothetical protein GXP70_22855 [Paenibacillus lycopersici]